MSAMYIANDVETSGSTPGINSVLSWGACVITQQKLSPRERMDRGLTFYVEFKPLTYDYEIEAMRVGCIGLRCIADLRVGDKRYDTASQYFEPRLVLETLANCGETVQEGVQRFMEWVRTLNNKNTKIVPVVDTVFFDSCFIQHLFGVAGEQSPYGWSGIDLDSLYRGYLRDMSGDLCELGLIDSRAIAHCAIDDAIFLADMAGELIFHRIIADK